MPITPHERGVAVGSGLNEGRENRYTIGMRVFLPLLAAIVLAAASAAAQNVTIQLPNFSQFGVNTTVVVPDSGPSPLAAERQAFYSRVMSRGLYPQRAYSAQRRAAIADVTATVHDQQKQDQEILLRSRARRTNWQRGSTAGRQADIADGQLQSVADIERQKSSQQFAAAREAADLLAQARKAREEGKSSVAAVYYGMAARKAAPDERARIEAEARALNRRPARVR
jgi:septal ring factor EnvC (AmiA/AmiB activator)